MARKSDKFARSGRSNPLGKCTQAVKSSIDDLTKEGLLALQREEGLPEAEIIRNVLQTRIHGAWTMLRLSIQPGIASPGIGPDKALEALAMLNGMSVDEYREKVINDHIFGVAGIPADDAST